MPAYNAELYIAESIKSVIDQTHQDWELLIVDDESKDETAAIIKSIGKKDPRIKYFWQENGKQGKARNRGLQEAKGKFIAFIDADDVWLPTKLEQQLADLNRQQVDLVFGHAFLLDGPVKTMERTGRGKGRYQGEEAVAFLLYHDAFVMSTVLARQEIIFKVGCFETDPAIQYCEDWHMWLNLALHGSSFYSNGEPVSYYRLHAASAAQVEKNAKLKFFLALVNLCGRYPQHAALQIETKRRGQDIVFHQDELTKNLVDEILNLFYPKKQAAITFLKIIESINSNLFRKLFLYLNQK